MAFRGSLASSVLSSSSLGNNRSQSNSRSSLQGGNSKPRRVLTHNKQQHYKTKTNPYSLESSQEDLHSYLSSFNSSKIAAPPGRSTKKHQKNIDWEKLVEASETAKTLGFEYEVNDYGGFEEVSSDDEQKGACFLKSTHSTKPRHNKGAQKQQTHSHKQASQLNPPSLRGSVGNKLSDLKYVRGSTDFVNTFGDEDESVSISISESTSNSVKQKLMTSDDTNTIDPLAHVKVASELTLSDDSDTGGNQQSLPVRQPTRETAVGHYETHLESELSHEDTDLEDLSISSEPLNLHKNVFSIDDLNVITAEDGVPLDTSSNTHSQSDSYHGPNLRNVFSIDDLETNGATKKSSIMSTKVDSSKKQTHNKNTHTSSSVVANATKESSNQQTGKSFKFSATSRIDPVRKKEAIQINSPTVSDTEQSIADSVTVSEVVEGNQSGRHGYSDDGDFESETLSEHDSSGEENTLAEVLVEDDTFSHHTTASETNATDHGRNNQSISDGDSYSSGDEHEQDMTELTESRQDHHKEEPSHKQSSTKETQHTCKCNCAQNVEGQGKYNSYIWPRVVNVGAHYGKEYLDPAPILPHVISADALEVLTAYSPSTVALTDMLRSQLYLTRQLVANSRDLVSNLSSNISADHHYTTLEETKEYIAKHRPRVITASEAMQQVEDEFGS